VAQVALNHHQRWDGRGYPERRDHKTGDVRPPLAGGSIPVFCRFVAPPDVFDTAVGERFFSEGKSPARALHEMRLSVNRGWFDPTVEQGFYGLAPPMPPGTTVRLSTGHTAVVVSFNPSAPARPRVVAVADADGRAIESGARPEIDLADSREVRVTHWLDQDVSAYVED
jgi:HD-GYP domain-containing protein (c-di-GMP phosphodiesterase class II)